MEVGLRLLNDKNSRKARMVKRTQRVRSNEVTECHVDKKHTLVGTPGLGFVTLMKPLVDPHGQGTGKNVFMWNENLTESTRDAE